MKDIKEYINESIFNKKNLSSNVKSQINDIINILVGDKPNENIDKKEFDKMHEWSKQYLKNDYSSLIDFNFDKLNKEDVKKIIKGWSVYLDIFNKHKKEMENGFNQLCFSIDEEPDDILNNAKYYEDF